MATLQSIARVAGVSVSTVAQVLRDQPGFRIETRQRVLDVAKQLNYRANYLSKALAGGKSFSVGLLIPSMSRETESRKFEAAIDAATAAGFIAFTVPGWGDDPEQLAASLQALLDRRVDGILIYRTAPLPEAAQRVLRGTAVPVVYMDWAPDDAAYAVRIDREAAFDQAAGHLAELGHAHAAFIGRKFQYEHPERQIIPFRRALERVGITLDAHPRWCETDSAYEPVSKLLVERPSVSVLLAQDNMILPIYAAIQDAGLRVPHDISVLGLGDLPMAAQLRPALSTIHQPREEVGQAAFKLLHSMIRDGDPPMPAPAFANRLIVRQSTGPARPRATARFRGGGP